MGAAEEVTKKRFLWGVLLAWTPWIPIAIGLVSAVMSQEGHGNPAGGPAELF